MRYRRYVFAAFVATVANAAFALQPPAGWSAQKQGAIELFTPTDLREGEVMQVASFPRASLGTAKLDVWLRRMSSEDTLAQGQWVGATEIKAENDKVAVGSRAWRDSRGKQGSAIYSAVSIDGTTARAARLIVSDSPDIRRHVAAAKLLMAQLVNDETRPPQTAARSDPPTEARRYQYLTAPGKGLAMSDVEAIVSSWEQVYRVSGLQMYHYVYLLLKDGTVRKGLPAAPEDMDVAASKRHEAAVWGRWRKAGGGYEFAWGDSGNFRAERHASVVRPARPNERLQGRWGSASSARAGNGVAWSFWGVTLGADGRFEKSSRGGAGATGPSLPDGTTVVGGAWDDSGSGSVVSGPNFGGGSSARSGRTKADRSGSYTLNGYTVELRYDNGRVDRSAFFLSGADNLFIWFEGSSLMRDKEAK